MFPSAKILKYVAAATAGLLLAACGSSSNSSSTAVQLRFVNATKSSNLTLALNGTAAFSNISSSTATNYAAVSAGNYAMSVSSPTGTPNTSTQTYSMGSGQTNTVFAFQQGGQLYTYVINENLAAPAAGYATVGLSNLAPGAGSLDVYLVASGTSLTGLSPTFPSSGFSATPIAATLVAGTYDIIATAAGHPNDVRSTVSGVSITSGEVLVLAYSPTNGGTLVDASLLTVAGTVAFDANTNARVRVVSGLSAASPPAAVDATVGGTALSTAYALPVPVAYQLVPLPTGSTASYSIQVNNAAITPGPTCPPTAAANFAAGGDYTLLVYGTSTATCVSIFADNNQLAAGVSNLRLVNAGSTTAGGISLYYNYQPVAYLNSVAYGAQSGYTAVTPSSAGGATIQVVEPGTNGTVTPASLITGSVYTVFVIDGSLTPYLVQDR